MHIAIDLPLDEKEYIDRRCPSLECGRHFKVVFDDWRNKVPDERAFCPYCRFEQDPQEWNTPEQQEHIRDDARLANQRDPRHAPVSPRRCGGSSGAKHG
ncbi:MAG: hypothetical protein L6Q92_11875 [Phycisphaerae bacterium]|nr:hypothetical protein [Phycisphaerae bacterium]